MLQTHHGKNDHRGHMQKQPEQDGVLNDEGRGLIVEDRVDARKSETRQVLCAYLEPRTSSSCVREKMAGTSYVYSH